MEVIYLLGSVVKFTLAANVPQKAYIDTSLPRWSSKSLTLASNPAQSALYASCPAKVNLRKLRGSAIRLRNTTSQRCISEEARNTYSELAIRPEGTDAGIIGLRSLKFKRCAELDGAARLRLTFALISPVRSNRYSTEERHSQVKNEARCKTTHLKSWCEKHITKPIARFFLFEQREGFVEGDGLRDVESAISGAT